MNKKAGERVLSIYLFIIYIIVSIGIVSGVIIFYGSPLDVREIEAGILSDKVIDCLVEQGKLNEEVLDEDFDLLDDCDFDFKDNTEKYQGEGQYGVKVEIYDFDSCLKTNGLLSCGKNLKSFSEGNIGFLEFCGAKGKKIPKCNLKEIYILGGKNKYLLKITSAVGKVQNA